jgi:DNA-binding transcriptional regulator YiaG
MVLTDEEIATWAGTDTGLGWLIAHVGYAGDDCLTWPKARNGEGYGQCAVGRKVRKANRIMCRLVHGEPPTAKHVAAHSCNNGHLGCVNPRHLSWKTHSENVEDKRQAGGRMHGRGGNRTTLTPQQVAEIRAFKGKMNAHEVAKLYGLSRPGVRYWQSTTHDPHPPHKRAAND